MQIWVDADACPKVIKDILFRAAEKRAVRLILVANQLLWIPPSRFIEAVRVASGFDVADRHIAQTVQAGDLVVTADIPLAAAVVERGAYALNPRGQLYDRDNVREQLALRDFMTELRDTGLASSGPSSFSAADRQAFANQLDRFLTRHVQPG